MGCFNSKPQVRAGTDARRTHPTRARASASLRWRRVAENAIMQPLQVLLLNQILVGGGCCALERCTAGGGVDSCRAPGGTRSANESLPVLGGGGGSDREWCTAHRLNSSLPLYFSPVTQALPSKKLTPPQHPLFSTNRREGARARRPAARARRGRRPRAAAARSSRARAPSWAARPRTSTTTTPSTK
jgi:hypothetical protein